MRRKRSSVDPEERRRLEARKRVAEETVCGKCRWSWAAGSEGQVLCMNPEAPHAYDIVPTDLSCDEQASDQDSY